MADKIVSLDAAKAAAITEAWEASYPNMVDRARNLDALRYHMFENPGAHWYDGVTEDSYFLVTNIEPGHQALVQFISVRGAPALSDWRTVVETMTGIMDDHHLIKLVWMVPGHARRLYDAVKRCKFDLEGWLKLGCIINKKPTDLATLGLFREDIDVHLGVAQGPTVARGKAQPKRKPRRKKRNSAAVVGDQKKEG